MELQEQLEKLMEESKYQTKLLESIVDILDVKRGTSAQGKRRIEKLTERMLKNPIFVQHPEAMAVFKDLVEPIASDMEKDK